MELSELRSRVGRSWWALLLIPLIAAGVGWFAVEDAEPVRTASTTVRVQAPGGADSPAARSAATDELVALLDARTLRAELAAEHGLEVREVVEGLQVEPVGPADLVELSFAHPDPELAASLLTGAVVAGQRALHGPVVAEATAAVESAEGAATAAEAALAEIRADTGVALATEEYRSKSSEVVQLRVSLTQAVAAQTRTGPVEEALERAEQELASLEEAVLSSAAPLAEVETTGAALRDAQEALATAERGLTVATDPAEVTVSAPTATSSSTTKIRAAVSAAVIGLGLAVLLVAVVAISRVGGSRRSHRDTRDAGADRDRARGPRPELMER